MKRPDKVWIFAAGSFGPCSKSPKVGVWSDGRWWDSSGDICVERIGLHKEGWGITYAAEEREKVVLFMLGFNAARKAMNVFTGDGE